MSEFKKLIKLICDWDEYIARLEAEDFLDEGSSEQIYDFMSNLYSCATTILVHAEPGQTLEFVKDMAKWGDVAEKLKQELLKEEEPDVLPVQESQQK